MTHAAAQTQAATAKALAARPPTTTTVDAAARAPVTTSAAAAVQKSAQLAKRKQAPTPYSTEEKRAFVERKAAERAEYRRRRSFFEAFPVEDLCVIKDGERSKLVLRGKDGLPDAKEKAMIELCAFRTVIGSRMDGEGNRGLGAFKPTPGEAKRSLGLAMGSIDGQPLTGELERDQPLCRERLKDAARAALGAWFDSPGIEHECASGHKAAVDKARTAIAFQEPETYHRSAAEVEEAEAEQSERGRALAARVRADARQAFIDGGRIPFGVVRDAKTKKLMPETAWVSNKVWPMQKNFWTAQLDKNRNKGPTLQAVPSNTKNMPRLTKLMHALGHEFRPPAYENGGVPAGAPGRTIRPPMRLVPDLDETGCELVDANGQREMVEVYDLPWNPLFETANKKKLISLAQCSVILGLSNGGQKGNYGVTLTLASPIVITAQHEQKAGESYQYDDEIATGLYQETEEDGGAEQTEQQQQQQQQEEHDANQTVTEHADLTGLPGAVPPPPVAPTTDGAHEGQPAAPPRRRR